MIMVMSMSRAGAVGEWGWGGGRKKAYPGVGGHRELLWLYDRRRERWSKRVHLRDREVRRLTYLPRNNTQREGGSILAMKMVVKTHNVKAAVS